jgi:hypothetical protein
MLDRVIFYRSVKAPPHFSGHNFWDTRINTIDFIRDKAFVIGRVLEMGNEDDERELYKYYLLSDIIRIAKHSTFNEGTLYYLSLVLDIPKEKFRCYGKKPYYRN